jgi:protocatechuate 3,4-dioxygenase beta subunit
VARIRRWGLPLILPFLLSLSAIAAAPAAATNGDNLRQITLVRTGTDCASLNAAGNHGSVGVGIAFNGVNLLASCYSDNTITENSPADGSLVAVHHIVGAGSLGALAWDNGRGVVWACSNFSQVGTINLATNVFTYAFTSNGCFDGLAYDAADDTLWTSPDATNHITHYSTLGVNLREFFPSLPCGNSGIAVGGSLLYLATNGCSSIYTSAKDFSSPPAFFASFNRRLEDLECDNLSFAAQNKAAIWSIDAYDNIVNAWEIPLGSCLFGGGAGQLTLTPATAQNPVGSSHTVTAHLADNNVPVNGASILFSVAGANTAAGARTTNTSGEATFTYSGSNAGADTITACWDENTNGACDPTESTATATKVWEGAGPPASLTLTPDTATNTAGQQHCVTATVTDANGTPTPGIPVDFVVSGANPQPVPITVVTDVNGQAQFCYVGTHAGTDTITATAKGGSNPSDTATKTYVAGAPATLTLTPEAATNFVDTQHCVTATVVDAFGNPVPNTTVTFTVTGSVTTTAQRTTDANGVATFCYAGPALPGVDAITATAGTATDAAAKTWVIPVNDTSCKVNNGGRIMATNGDKATFGGNAKGRGPSGHEEYQDHGGALDINVHSIGVLTVTCSRDGTQASIFGTATINGAGSYDFRIDVKDLAEPGRTDTYRIRLSTGYDSGEHVLSGGNIQIH